MNADVERPSLTQRQLELLREFVAFYRREKRSPTTTELSTSTGDDRGNLHRMLNAIADANWLSHHPGRSKSSFTPTKAALDLFEDDDA